MASSPETTPLASAVAQRLGPDPRRCFSTTGSVPAPAVRCLYRPHLPLTEAFSRQELQGDVAGGLPSKSRPAVQAPQGRFEFRGARSELSRCPDAIEDLAARVGAGCNGGKNSCRRRGEWVQRLMRPSVRNTCQVHDLLVDRPVDVHEREFGDAARGQLEPACCKPGKPVRADETRSRRTRAFSGPARRARKRREAAHAEDLAAPRTARA